jgi:hypothetical protein
VKECVTHSDPVAELTDFVSQPFNGSLQLAALNYCDISECSAGSESDSHAGECWNRKATLPISGQRSSTFERLRPGIVS